MTFYWDDHEPMGRLIFSITENIVCAYAEFEWLDHEGWIRLSPLCVYCIVLCCAVCCITFCCYCCLFVSTMCVWQVIISIDSNMPFWLLSCMSDVYFYECDDMTINCLRSWYLWLSHYLWEFYCIHHNHIHIHSHLVCFSFELTCCVLTKTSI